MHALKLYDTFNMSFLVMQREKVMTCVFFGLAIFIVFMSICVRFMYTYNIYMYTITVHVFTL